MGVRHRFSLTLQSPGCTSLALGVSSPHPTTTFCSLLSADLSPLGKRGRSSSSGLTDLRAGRSRPRLRGRAWPPWPALESSVQYLISVRLRHGSEGQARTSGEPSIRHAAVTCPLR